MGMMTPNCECAAHIRINLMAQYMADGLSRRDATQLARAFGPDWIAYNEEEHGRAYIGANNLFGGMLPGDIWHGEEQSEKWIGNDGI